MIDNTLPLVSFCVKSFNQKKFLIEALKGAFAQTYRPLEIVISDDGSTDGSWEYILSACEDFRRNVSEGKVDAGVTVIVNRNERNLGNLGNWQKCGELAHGELCIKADGDDVSLPNRTESTVRAWLVAGRNRVKSISCGGWKIDTNGEVIGRVERSTARNPIGAVMAWTRDCFYGFGPIVYPWAFDDIVFGRRSMLLGDDISIDDPLVLYRVGSGVTSYQYDHRAAECRLSKSLFAAYEQIIAEIACSTHIKCMDRGSMTKMVYNDFSSVKVWHQLQGAKTMGERFMAYKKMGSHDTSLATRFYLFVHVLPLPIGAVILLPYYFIKHWIGRLKFAMTKHPQFIGAFALGCK